MMFAYWTAVMHCEAETKPDPICETAILNLKHKQFKRWCALLLEQL